MRIGVAIPCYRRHLNCLQRLLDSLEFQTRKPDYVSVSCSSCKEEDLNSIRTDYTFPVKIQYHQSRKNAAENRNLAANVLDTDTISFIDADDLMHPQRLQAICIAFENNNIEFVLHSYNSENDFKMFDEIEILESELIPDENESSLNLKCRDYPIQHAHISIRKHCLENVKFNESSECERIEDAIFCRNMMFVYGIKNAFMPYALSIYVGEHQTYTDDNIVGV